MKLEISKIRTDGDTQARYEVYPDIVLEYAEVMEEFECKGCPRFPQIVVFFDGENYWLGDGFHRLAAAIKCKLYEIDCEIRQGTQRDARLYAASANTEHGLQRNNEDKRIAVRVLLEDDEWRDWSDHSIADHCGVSQPFVGKIREVLYPPTDNRYQSNSARVGRDGRTINTENIGKAQRQRDLREHLSPPVTEVEPVTPRRQTTVEELLRPDGKPAPSQEEGNGEVEDMTEMLPESKPVPADPAYQQRLDTEALLAAQSRLIHQFQVVREKQREYLAKKDTTLIPALRVLEKKVDAAIEEILKNYEF